MTITIAMLDSWCTITPPQILPTVSALGAATSARSHACTKWQLTQSMHSKLARPWRLYMRNGFLRRNQNPSLKCTGSSFPTNPVCQLLLLKKHHLRMFVASPAVDVPTVLAVSLGSKTDNLLMLLQMLVCCGTRL